MNKNTIGRIIISILLITTIFTVIIVDYNAKHVSLDRAEQVSVYITKTGSCYHDEDCHHIEYSKIEISLEEAAKEYRRCSVCNPPIIENDE